MRINSKILAQRLGKSYPVEVYGKENSKMLFSSAEIYINNSMHFYAEHVYLATVDHLPLRPVVEKNVILVCIGDGSRLSYYKEHATVLLIREKADIFAVHRTLLQIFQSFHNWESTLLELFVNAPTIQDILQHTASVFERSLMVFNASFQYSAEAHYSFTDKYWTASDPGLDPDAFLSYLREQDLRMDRKGAFRMEFERLSVLCCNLFDAAGEYIGCVVMDLVDRPYAEGEDQLLDYLATILEKVCETNPMLLNRERNTLKDVLQALMAEMPLSKKQQLLLKSTNRRQNYVCLSVHYMKEVALFPSIYVCAVFETLFPDSIFFEQNCCLLGLVPVSSASTARDDARTITEAMAVYAREMQLNVGISNSFNDLYMLRAFYHQAEAAIENGCICRPGESFYLFSDFALMELITNATGNLPIEAYYPKGFRELLAHDQESDISYQETLTVFLEENMSYAQTARRLYIHRSTLVERLSRIVGELALDLKDPDQRLYLQLILKALALEKSIRNQ